MKPIQKRFSLSALLACALIATSFLAQAADKSGAKDYPAISRFKGSDIVDYQVIDFDEATLPIKPIASQNPYPPEAFLKVEGKITRIAYRMPPNKTATEVMRNYMQALGSTYKTVFACSGTECGAQFTGYAGNSGKVVPTGWSASFNSEKNRYLLAQRSGSGGDTYVIVYAMEEGNSNPVTVYQEVVELQPMQAGQVTVLDASALKRGLDADGKVAVYGVYFDTAKSDVKPESKPSLDEMAKLLNTNRTLKVYIVGHTDNAGSLAANLDLSQRRADAVVKALVGSYKIDAQRLAARGVASLAPVASNTDDAGRARNRRVELVVQ